MPKIIATKEDWIKLGYKLFAADGYNGINVEKMAKKLKVNKSSFYWHFKTKASFLNEIISYWITSDTDKIIEAAEKEKTPLEKFDNLVKLSFKQVPQLDFIFFLKRHAQKDKTLKSMIDDIDSQRIAYTKDILLGLGFRNNEAGIKSQLFYKYLIGYHEMLRYKKQPKDYIAEVKKELNQFINY